MRHRVTTDLDTLASLDLVAYFARPLGMHEWLANPDDEAAESGHIDPRYARRKAREEARVIRRYRNWHGEDKEA